MPIEASGHIRVISFKTYAHLIVMESFPRSESPSPLQSQVVGPEIAECFIKFLCNPGNLLTCDRRAFQVPCKSLAPLGDIGISLA
jgi:hypothetical protein